VAYKLALFTMTLRMTF